MDAATGAGLEARLEQLRLQGWRLIERRVYTLSRDDRKGRQSFYGDLASVIPRAENVQ